MQNPKIVFFDIDDTLYRKHTDTLRPSVGEAVRALKLRGILTAIATGRPPVAIPQKVKELINEAGIDMLVTINGQYIHFKGETLQAYPMDAEEIAALCAFFDAKNMDYAFVNNAAIAVSQKNQTTEAALSDILPDYLTDKYYFRHTPVYQMLVFADETREQEIAETVNRAGMKTVRWHENAVDMLRTEGSKARGITDALAKLGIEMKDAMAFGDGYNDVEMLSAVGFGIAMGNSVDAAKAAARYICPSVDEDGVLRALQELGVI